MTRAEREEKQAQAVEQLLSGEEAEVKQYREEGRLWRSVAITTARWGEAVKGWHPYTVKKRGGKGESVEQIVVFVLKIRDQRKIAEVEKAILQRNRQYKPRELKGKAVDSPLRVGSTISIPGPLQSQSPPQVTALADTGQFTVTAGYAKINVVEIPRRRGISVFAGYDPITATLPVLLLDMPYGKGQTSIVDRQCAVLEWMAGRGKAINGAPAPAPASQAPYAVSLSSVNPSGHFTSLVPANYNSAAAGGVQEWYITGIQWGDSLRDREAKRRKQHLVLTLTENAPLAANEANASQRGV